MPKLHQFLASAALLACTQLAHAQNPAGVTTGPHTPTTVPPSAMPEANGAQTSGGTRQGQSNSADGTLVIGTIIETEPAARQPTAGELSGDPFILRREARAQARKEYKERVEAARREYRADKRAADAILQSGN